MQQELQQSELRRAASVLRRRRRLVFAIALLTVVLAALFTAVQPTLYRSTVEFIYLPARSIDGAVVQSQLNDIDRELQRADREVVKEEVRRAVGYLPNAVISKQKSDTVIRFVVEGKTAEDAQLAAQTWADAYAASRDNARLEAISSNITFINVSIADGERRLGELTEERTQIRDAARQDIDDIDDQLEDARLELFDAEEDSAEAIAAQDDVTRLERERSDIEEARDTDLSLIQEEFNQLGFSLSQLRLQRQQAAAAETSASDGLEVQRQASLPSDPFQPAWPRNLILGLLAGSLLGAAAAFVVDHLDDAVNTEDDVYEATGGLPSLALVPMVRLKKWGTGALITLSDPRSAAAESYRSLRTSLRFITLESECRTLLVTSPMPGEGKSTTAANLAVALAESGDRVVLIDCDFRRPKLQEYFGIDNELGVTSALIGDVALDDLLAPLDRVPTLTVLTTGPKPADPIEMLSSVQLANLVSDVLKRADLVVIDSPPVLPVSDARVLSDLIDGVILVSSVSRTQIDQTRRAVQLLRQVDAPLLGTVLNRVPTDGSYGYNDPYFIDDDEQQPLLRRIGAFFGGGIRPPSISKSQRSSGSAISIEPREDYEGINAVGDRGTAPLPTASSSHGSPSEIDLRQSAASTETAPAIDLDADAAADGRLTPKGD